MLSDPNLAMSRFPWDFRLGDFRIPPSIFAFLFARSKSTRFNRQEQPRFGDNRVSAALAVQRVYMRRNCDQAGSTPELNV